MYGELLSERKERAFEQNLRHIFTVWQITIIQKKLEGEELTATERVEFSRKIRKKIVAIDILKDLHLLLD